MKHIFLSTPVHGWEITGAYWLTVEGLKAFCQGNKIKLTLRPKFGQSDLILARNVAVHEFLKTDADVFLTFDSDQKGRADDIFEICEKAWKTHRITACPVPKKTEDLLFNYTVIPDQPPQIEGRYMRVATVGAGCMATARNDIEHMCYENPVFMLGGEPIPDLYGRDYVDIRDGIWPIQFSEDYSYCVRASKVGIETWVYWPGEVEHMGSKMFRGRLTCPQ